MNFPEPRLSVARIAEIVARARLFDLKCRSQKGDLERCTRAIYSLFNSLQDRDIDYIIVGDLGTLAYILGRNTSYIDLIIDLDDLLSLKPTEVSVVNSSFAIAKFDNISLSIMLARDPLFDKLRQEFRANVSPSCLPVATPKGIVTTSLYSLPYWYCNRLSHRTFSIETDIALLSRACDLNLYDLYRLVCDYLPANHSLELEKIVKELEARKNRQNRFC